MSPISRQRWKLLLPIGVTALGAIGMAILIFTRPPVERQEIQRLPPRVRVLQAQPRSVGLSVNTHGTVAPRSESDLVPQVSGPVVRVAPSLVSGGFFEEGEVLLEIDPRDYRVALERARATLVRSESEYARAEKELGRLLTLRERNVASDSQVDDAENAERVAGAAVREARAQLEQAERDLDRTRLRAPFRGRVREESVGVGQFVNRGSPIAKLYATDYAEVRLPISDRELGFLELPVLRANGHSAEPGPRVTLRAEFAGAEHSWQGALDRTEGEIDARSRMIHVVARVQDPYAQGDRPPLAVGLFVRAEIEGRRVEGAYVLPRSALHGGADGRYRVWVVDGEDRLRAREVEVLRAQQEQVVIGGGLEPGLQVVVSPLETPIEGMAVRAQLEPGTGATS